VGEENEDASGKINLPGEIKSPKFMG